MVVTADGGGGAAPDVLSPDSIGDLATFLDTIEVDSETVSQIVGILNQGAQGIEGQVIEDVPTPVFGGSASGSQLGYHTSLAHRKVTEAMNLLMTDLLAIEKNVIDYQRSQEYNDDMTRVELGNVMERIGGLFGGIFGGPR